MVRLAGQSSTGHCLERSWWTGTSIPPYTNNTKLTGKYSSNFTHNVTVEVLTEGLQKIRSHLLEGFTQVCPGLILIDPTSQSA